MRGLVTLRPAVSKKLIARAVARMPEVRRALDRGVLVIGAGSTNAEVAAECVGLEVDRARFVAGMITRGATCATPREERSPNLVVVRGEPRDLAPSEALDLDLEPKALVKGANAVDPSGVAGVLMAAADGGTIGRLLGRAQAGGWPLVVPVGLEKLVPSVQEASMKLGRATLDRSRGARVGLMPVISRHLVTELQAFDILAGVRATQVAAGGIGGSEGAVTLVLEGDGAGLDAAFEALDAVEDAERPDPVLTRCADCGMSCDYAGLPEEDLPSSLRR